MAYTIPGPTISGDNTVLNSAVLVSESDRARDVSNAIKAEVLVRSVVGDEARVVSVGEWDQRSNKLDAGKNRELLSSGRAGMRLRDKQQIVVRVTETGSPSSPTDMAVTVELEEVGGVTGRALPLVQTGTEIEDQATREAVDGIVSSIARSRMGRWTERIRLIDKPSSAGSTDGGTSYTDSSAINYFWTSSLQTHNTTSYVDVNNTTHGDDTEYEFSGLDDTATYELEVQHTLHCLNGGNSNGKIQIDVNGVATLVNHQDNGTRFLAAGASRNDVVGRAFIRFTGVTSITINQQFALNSGSTSVSFEGSSWLAVLRKVVS